MTTAPGDITARLRQWLDAYGAAYRHFEHEPVFTSEQAARVRGTDPHSGAKALVMKGDDGFVLAVIPADLELDGPAFRKRIGSRKLRFATREELLHLTGLAPGAVPPFGSLFGLSTHCDARLAENEFINFNAGSHSESLQIAYADYVRCENPELGAFARPAAHRDDAPES